ncbi:MAG: T9SS type A sorting domain-containing protein, partial [Candidatus Latescibacterota bacterium]
GSDDASELYWRMDRSNVQRWGRAVANTALEQGAAVVEAASFMIYPNPVSGREVRVRVMLNKRARIVVDIYNFEGESALSREFTGNPTGIIQTPFDMPLDVTALKSGVYFVRLQVEGTGESSVLVKPFAIKR